MNPLATLAILFHFCGLREGENLRALATSVHEDFSIINLQPWSIEISPAWSIEHSEKCSGSLISFIGSVEE